jgi:hypothetical protein
MLWLNFNYIPSQNASLICVVKTLNCMVYGFDAHILNRPVLSDMLWLNFNYIPSQNASLICVVKTLNCMVYFHNEISNKTKVINEIPNKLRTQSRKIWRSLLMPNIKDLHVKFMKNQVFVRLDYRRTLFSLKHFTSILFLYHALIAWISRNKSMAPLITP